MKKRFSFDLKIPGQQTKRFRMKEKFTIGSGDEANLRLRKSGLPSVALTFDHKDGVPTVTCLESLEDCRLKEQELKAGKRYILEAKDVINLGKIEITFQETMEEPPAEEQQEDEETAVMEQEEENSIELALQVKKEDDHNTHQETTDEPQEAPQETKILPKNKPLKRSPKDFFSKKKTKKSKTIKKRRVRGGPFPGFFVRFPALILSLILVLGVELYVLPGHEWQQTLMDLCERWGGRLVNFAFDKFFAVLKEEIPPAQVALMTQAYEPIKSQILAGGYYVFDIVRLIFLAVSIDLISHLLLGTSFPLFLFGVTDKGSFLAKRLRGGIRSIIGWFTLLPLVYDAPLLIGKRSFKEVITMTRLEYRKPFMRYVGPWIVFPLCVILFLGVPMIDHYKELLKDVSFVESNLKNVDWDSNAPKVGHGFFLKGRLKVPENWILMPFYKKGQKEKSTWGIYFFDLDKQSKVKFDVQKTWHLPRLISHLREEDPLLKYFSPKLNTYLSNKKTSEIPPEDIRLEIENIFFSSLALSSSTLPDFIKSRGIFFKPYLTIRKNFHDDVLRTPGKGSYHLKRFEDRSFLEVESEGKKKNRSLSFFPITGLENPFFRLSYTTKNRSFAKKLVRSFAKNYSPPSSEGHLFEPGGGMALWDAYNIPDFMKTLHKRAPDKKELRQVVDFFMPLGKMALEEKNKEFRKIFLAELKKIDKFLKNMVFAEELNIELNQIQKAVEQGSRDFFSVNDPK